MILGFDGSRDQNVFVTQKGLESKVDAVLNRISQMQRISCSGGQMPTVRVSVVANTPTGPVEAFDFAEYQPELFEKFRNMRSQHPYVLTADTLKVYQNKFRQSSPDSVKVSAGSPFFQLPLHSLASDGRENHLRVQVPLPRGVPRLYTLFMFDGVAAPEPKCALPPADPDGLKCKVFLIAVVLLMLCRKIPGNPGLSLTELKLRLIHGSV